jgi:hypothetical protein
MNERIEEFTQDGKNFMYIDFSGYRTNEEFIDLILIAEPLIANYPKMSLYTISNIDNIRLDSKLKEIIAKYMEHNKPYVKYSALFGLDGIKKVMASSIAKMSGRENIHFAFTKEKAIEWLLEQD